MPVSRHSALRNEPHGRPAFVTAVVRSRAEYQRHLESDREAAGRRRALEAALATGGAPFTVDGHCAICDAEVAFAVDYDYAYPVDGVLTPNWREHLVCPGCRLNNRMRATLDLIRTLLAPPASSRVYVTEQASPIYDWLAARFPATVGSEFLGDRVAPGSIDRDGRRHEDLTRLSFADRAFDLVVSLDVLEHVPDYRRALGECLRVLAPGGHLLLTVPFRSDRDEHLVRARRRADGEIEHLEEPEYHHDPLHPEDGCLAYHHFGWALLEEARAIGFDDARAVLCWSERSGYLGAELPFFVFARDADRRRR